MKLESKIQSEILTYLNGLPRAYAFKVNPPPKGIPDVHAIIDGRPYYFEVKRTDSDDPRHLQEYRIKQLREAGGIAEVVRSVDDVKGFVKV